MAWHSAHTILVCFECPAVTVSPGARARARAHADALDRRQARGAAVIADIDPGAEDRARAARIETARKRELLRDAIEQMIKTCDEARAAPRRPQADLSDAALDIRATLRGYLGELAAADDGALEKMGAELAEGAEDDDYRRLAAVAAAGRRKLGHADGDEGDDEGEQLGGDEDDEGQGDELDGERRYFTGTAQAAYYDALTRRDTLPAPRPRAAITRTPLPYGGGVIGAAVQIHRHRKAATAAAIQQNGQCGFCTRPANRIYGVSHAFNGGQMPGIGPQIRACAKHHADGDRWIEANRGDLPLYYWELT
jgi:hypothetical protein